MFENRIDDKNIIPLVKTLLECKDPNFQIVELLLPYNKIGNDGLIVICDLLKGENTNIASLDLHSNDIGTEGCKKLCEVLHNNTVLSNINLHSNYIGDQGGLYISELLSINRTIRSIDIGENEIRTDCVISLCQTLWSNNVLEELNMDCIVPASDDGEIIVHFGEMIKVYYDLLNYREIKQLNVYH